MQGTIKAVRLSKSGKTYSVLVNDKWYTAALTTGLNECVGQGITFDPKDQEYQGGTITWINEFTLSGKPSQGQLGGAGEAKAQPASGYQPLVSNLAAHLIAASREPSELRHWFDACKAVLEPPDAGV